MHRASRQGMWRFGLAVVLLGACGDPLPEDLRDYADDCLLMNAEPIPPTDDDPHEGFKSVYVCGVDEADFLAPDGTVMLPWPEGTVLLKASIRGDADFAWAIATMDKGSGDAWSWAEYTRNFEGEPFAQAPVSEDLCTDCHRKVEAVDWVFTPYDR